MSATTSYRFPFVHWRKKKVRDTLAKVRREIPQGVALELEEDDEIDPTSFDLIFEETERRTGAVYGGRLTLLSGEEGDPASLHIHHEQVDEEALETADLVASAFCRLLGGHPETDEHEHEHEGATDGPRTFEDFAELRARIAEDYEIDGASEVVALTLSWEGSTRTQLVTVTSYEVLDEPWVLFRSRFAQVRRMTPEAALFRANEALVCGVLREGKEPDDVYFLNLPVPLFGLTWERFERILYHVAKEADELEEQITGEDEF